MLYIAMNGARQALLGQAANNHNLANVSTTGFRADLEAFRSLPLVGPGYASRAYAVAATHGADLSQGVINHTGGSLDIAIDGEGWIAVQTPDGSEAYTRAGDLHVTPLGQLLAGNGLPVLGNGGPIALPPYEKVDIGEDGTLTVLPQGQAPSTLAVVDRIKLVNPAAGNLVKGEDGLMRLRDGGDAPPDGSVRVLAGALERSNVNAVEAMGNMISLARQFEMHVKVMQAAQENDAASAQIMRLG